MSNVHNLFENETEPKASKPRKKRESRGGLHYYPKAKQWKASNVVFNEADETAYSYGWWRFVERIGGLLVFNSYRYSPSTARHQSKVRSFFRYADFDLEIEAPKGLQDLDSAVRHYERRIEALKEEIARPGTKAAKNLERRRAIASTRGKIEVVRMLIKLQRKGRKEVA